MRAPCDETAIRTGEGRALCSPESRGWILAAAILGSSMAFIDSTVVNVALPAIQASFHADVVDIQWVVESYGLLLGAFILVGGALGDLLGRRVVFLTGIALFALASGGCGLASGASQLILARGIQGLGAALLVPGSLAIISVSFDEENRGRAIGTWSGFTAITTALGPVLGGWLVEHASWRWAFFINLPLAAAVIAISLRHVPESRSSNAKRIDWFGATAVTIGLGGVVTGLVESSNLGWRHPLVVISLIAGLVSLLAFVAIERRVESPMVPLDLFSSSKFTGANLLTLLLYAAIGAFFFLFPLNLIQVQSYSATKSGAALLPFILLMFLLSRWSGGLINRFGPRLPLMVGPIIVAAGFALIARPALGHDYWSAYFVPVVVLGFGMAMTVAPLTTVVMNSVRQERAGTASGINNAVARVAGVMAVAVVGVLMVAAFGGRLNQQIAKMPLPEGAAQEIRMQENRLAGLQLPKGLDDSSTRTVKSAVAESFLFGFRRIMLLCAGLAAASAAAAAILIHDPHPSSRSH